MAHESEKGVVFLVLINGWAIKSRDERLILFEGKHHEVLEKYICIYNNKINYIRQH